MDRNSTFKLCSKLINELPLSELLNEKTLIITNDDLLIEIHKIISGRLWIIAKLKEKEKCFYYDESIYQLVFSK